MRVPALLLQVDELNTLPASVCPLFFDQETTESLCDRDPVDSGGFASGAILRELIRSTSGMSADFGSGCSADQDLAAKNPEMALYNPDNYSVSRSIVYVPPYLLGAHGAPSASPLNSIGSQNVNWHGLTLGMGRDCGTTRSAHRSKLRTSFLCDGHVVTWVL